MIKNNLHVVKYYNRFTFVFKLGMPHGVNTMTRFVVVVGTADTKLDELVWLKCCLYLAGVDSIIINVSTSIPGKNYQNKKVDIHSLQVTKYHPVGADPVFCGMQSKAITAMPIALTNFLNSSIDDIAGVIGIGGSGETALITPAAMQSLPIDLPKIMVSTMASGNVRDSNIAMLYTVTDLNGLNRISRSVLSNAANMMTGSVNYFTPLADIHKPALELTMFGMTAPCIDQTNIKDYLVTVQIIVRELSLIVEPKLIGNKAWKQSKRIF